MVLDGEYQRPLRVVLAAECTLLGKGLWQVASENDAIVILGQTDTIEELPDLARECEAEVMLLALLETSQIIPVIQQLPHDLKMVCLVPPTSYKLTKKLHTTDGSILYRPLTESPEKLLEDVMLLATGAKQQVHERHVSLTDRQLEVLNILALGKPNSQIASELSVTEETIKAHLTMIYRKLEVRSRAEAVARYLESTSHRKERSRSDELDR